MSAEVDQIVWRLQSEIDERTTPLSDAEFLEALEEIVAYCQIAISAKREELGE